MPLFVRLLRPQTLAEAWTLLDTQAETIARLEAENAALRAEVDALRAHVQTLTAQVHTLTARLGQHSGNSHRPPSSDPPHRPRPAPSPPSGRRPGGQPGHVGHGRLLRPPDQVDHVVAVRPVACAACGALLLGADPHPARHQVTELPAVRPEVTEYQRHTLPCLAGGTQTSGDWPPAMPPGDFGPRVEATVGYLTGRLGVSQRDTAEALDALFHIEVSLGSIPALEQAVSAALAAPVAAAQVHVQAQPTQNVDETSWREGKQRCWLWVSATALVTVFLVLAKRGAAEAKQLIVETYAGIVGSDRHSAYGWLDPWRRQVCWAHLKRDFQSFVERGGKSAQLGRLLLAQVAVLFDRWHRYQDGTLSRDALHAAMPPVMRRVGTLLRVGTTLAHDQTRGTCQKLLTLEVALWTFVRVDGVEPTNNSAERPLRRGVLWRRRSLGTQSPEGSRFVERVLTTVTTLRQQHRDVLAYLTAACAAAMRGEPSPSLLPTGAVPPVTT
jgi:transposase